MNALDKVRSLGKLLIDFEPVVPLVEESGRMIVECLRNGGKILTCGNGGSAADALHLAEELVGKYEAEREPLAGICLAADVTAMTCIGNDYGFESVFSRPTRGLGRSGDVLVAFSTSGNSANIIEALDVASEIGVRSILVTGKDGGKARAKADHAIVVPSPTTARIQEVHCLILHLWLDQVDASCPIAL